MLKPSSPWLHRHGTPPRSGNGMPNLTAQLFQPQKQLFITGEVLSEAGRSQWKGFSIQHTECGCPCCVLYTLRRAAKRPLAASLLATLALGHRRCLIVSRSFAGLRTTLKFNARQIPGTPLRRYTYHSQFIRHTCALVDTECHGSPSVAKHASISNSETSPAREECRITQEIQEQVNRGHRSRPPGRQIHKTSQTPSRYIQILSLSVFCPSCRTRRSLRFLFARLA